MLKRQLISIVSAVLLAAHVSVGCCAHHEHADNGAAIITFVAQHGHHHGHTARNDDCEHSTPQHDHEPGDHHCGEGHCSFLAVCRVGVPDLASDWAIVLTTAESMQARVGQQATTHATPTDSTGLLSVRSHLVKQVLLI